MTVKDFKVGETAYILNMNTGSTIDPSITETSIQKIGRKYVTISDSWGSKFQTSENGEDQCFLIESRDYGWRRMLFKTHEEAMNYVEKHELTRWLACMGFDRVSKYTLEQLRKVKEILG